MRKTVLRVRTKKVENSSERRPVGGILSSTTTPRLAAQQKKATMLSAAKHLRTVEQRSWGGATKLVSDLGDTVIAVAVSADDVIFAAGGVNRLLNVYSTSNGMLVTSFRLPAIINAITFSDTGENTKLFVGTFGGLVHCKHVQTEQELGSVKFLNGEAVLCLAASDNPHRLAAGGMSSVVCVYDVEPTRVEGQAETCEFREILRLKTAGNVLSLTIKFDGSLLVTGGEAKMLQLWDVDKSLRSKAADNSSEGNALVREAVAQYTTATSVQSLSMLPDGSLLAVGTAEGTEVYLINRKEVWVKDSTPPGKTLAHEVAAAAQHRIVFRHFSFNDSGAGQWENEYSLEPSTWFHCSANQGGVSLARRAGRDETMLAIAGHNLISTFSLATHAPLRQMTRGGRVRCVALSRDGAIVIAGGFDKKVTLNLVEEGTQYSHFGGEDGATVRSVHLTPDSSRLALGGEKDGKGFVLLYNTNTESRLACFEHSKPTWCVRLSPNGQLLAAAGYDMTMTLYDAVTLLSLMQIKYPPPMPAFIWSMSFSRNGSYLAVGCWNKIVYLYEVNKSRSYWRAARSWLDSEYKMALTQSAKLQTAPSQNCLSKLWAKPDSSLDLSKPTDEVGVAVTETTTVGELKALLADITQLSVTAFLVSFEGTALMDEGRRLVACKVPNEGKIIMSNWTPSEQDPPSSPPPPKAKQMLTEVTKVSRTDRVYAVALDGSGRYMAVGGRDKCVVLYDMKPEPDSFMASEDGTAGTEPIVVWEKVTDDFIYTVSLTEDLKYLAYGGTAKRAHLCDGISGRELFQINAANTVWSTALLSEPAKLIFGGESTTISVIDLVRLTEELQLPVKETIQAISLTSDAICFANGRDASMYGKSGIRYGWQDQPAYSFISKQMLSLKSTEETLVKFISLVLGKHPAVVNSHDPVDGTSLLQFAVTNCPMPKVIDVFLKADVKLGLGADKQFVTALLTSVQQGKWRALQQMIDALLAGRFGFSPTSMRFVMQAFASMATKHPREFLYLVTHMPLEAEPEVLSVATSNAHDIMLPGRLVAGSDMRCPRGLWEARIEQYRVVKGKHDDGSKWPSKGSNLLGISAASLLKARSSATRSSTGSEDDHSSGSARRKSHRSRVSSSKPKEESIPTRLGLRFRNKQKPQLGRMLSTAVRRSSQVMMGALANPSKKSSGKLVEEGYCKAAREGGISAMRIPFHNIAGYVENSRGVKHAPLSLIVDAVAATHEYAVFGAQSVEIMLEYKWKGFALRGFLKALLFFVIHLVAATVFNFYASRTIDLTVDEIIGAEEGTTPYWGLLLGWAWTTLICLWLEYNESYQVRMRGWYYFGDYVNVLDQTFMIGQLSLNVMFWLRDSDTISAKGALIPINPSVPTSSLDLNLTSSGQGYQQEEIGIFLTMESLVVLSLFLRLVGYSRGVLALGALVHMVAEVFLDIVPFMMLLSITTIGFSLSLNILLKHTQFGTGSQQYGEVGVSLYSFFNMGVYGEYGEGVNVMRQYWQVLLVYEIFMLTVQLVLLNLLIGIMTDVHSRVRDVALLVAHFERAKLVLDEEAKLMRAHHLREESLKKKQKLHNKPVLRWLNNASSWINSWFSELPSMDQITPQWLHVLLPVDLNRKVVSGEKIWRQELSTSVDELGDKLNRGQQKLMNMVNDVDRERRDREAALHKQALSALNAEVEKLRGMSTNRISKPNPSSSTSDSPLENLDQTGVDELRSEMKHVSARMEQIESMLHQLVDHRTISLSDQRPSSAAYLSV